MDPKERPNPDFANNAGFRKMQDIDGFLPIEEKIEVSEPGEVAGVVAESARRGKPVYPIGGGSRLGYGGPVTQPGVALQLARLQKLVDYPSRDLTITVEAGMPLKRLQEILAGENQWLPGAASWSERMTVGGWIATAWPGPRDAHYGSVADFFLGFRAVDGRGEVFSGGSRVVKNAAGYNLPRLLAGSLGSLAVLLEVTLMVRPRPESSAFLILGLRNWEKAQEILRALGPLEVQVAAVELLAGPMWGSVHPAFSETQLAEGALWVAFGLEGWQEEIKEIERQVLGRVPLSQDLKVANVPPAEAPAVWQALESFSAVEFPNLPGGISPSKEGEGLNQGEAVLLQIRVLPAKIPEVGNLLRSYPEFYALQAHGPRGIVWVWMITEEAKLRSELLPGLWRELQKLGGTVVVARRPPSWQLSRNEIWGIPEEPNPADPTRPVRWQLMARLKAEFDPAGILNPGRMPW